MKNDKRVPNVLTQYLRVNEARLKLEKEEEKLKEQIKAALGRGEVVKNHARRAVLIPVPRRFISPADFIEAFDYARFTAVAEVSVTKVDALVKLGALQEADVRKIAQERVSHRIGTEAL